VIVRREDWLRRGRSEDCCHRTFSLFLFPPILGQSVYRRQFMRWRKVRVANGHLDVFVTGKLLYRSQINPGHHEARDIRVPENVPRNVLKRFVLLDCFLHDQLKPGTGGDHRFAIAGEAHM